jgi:hypothetical protein
MYATCSSNVARLLAAACSLAIAVAFGLTATGADAASSQWRAKWAGNSAAGTVESGQVFPAIVKAENVGTSTWFQGTVRLGTVGPTDNPASGQDRISAFAHPSWYSANRPADLAEGSVPQGGVGTFSFLMRAPEVSQASPFREYLAPVAEGIEWMYNCPDWCGVHIFGTVQPAQDPAVNISSAPRSVTAGDAIDVQAEASDNVGVNRVVFSLEDEQIVASAPPYRARFSSHALSAGTHVIQARVYDHVERQDSDVATVSVRVPAGGGTDVPGGGQLPVVGVSINEAAAYTNDALVRLRLRPPSGASGAIVSNDGGFDDALRVPVTGEQTISWRLVSSGPERLPKTVHVRFTGSGVDENQEYTDEIILDTTRPRIGRVGVRTRRGHGKAQVQPAGAPGACARRFDLRINARDNASRVRTLRYGFAPRAVGTSVRFRRKRRVVVPARLGAPRFMFVRVVDGAGNLSKTRRVSLRPLCR